MNNYVCVRVMRDPTLGEKKEGVLRGTLGVFSFLLIYKFE